MPQHLVKLHKMQHGHASHGLARKEAGGRGDGEWSWLKAGGGSWAEVNMSCTLGDVQAQCGRRGRLTCWEGQESDGEGDSDQ